MAYTDAFESFDPLAGKLPAPLQSLFAQTVARARAILARRRREQVYYGLQSLDWILNTGNQVLLRNVIEPPDVSHCANRVSTDARELCLYMDYFDISRQPEFPGATWPEYFAILSLSFVGEAVKVSRAAPITAHLAAEHAHVQRAGWISDLAIEAEDAVSFAETLLSQGHDFAAFTAAPPLARIPVAVHEVQQARAVRLKRH